MYKTNDYWIPKYKWQLVQSLTQRYPGDAGKFKRMAKAQLYQIYKNIRRIANKINH